MISRIYRPLLRSTLPTFRLNSQRSFSFLSWARSLLTPQTHSISQEHKVHLKLKMSSSQHTISPIPPPPANRKLEAKDGALVWIDCEMTGLDVESERIIEIACIITDGQLNPVDEGVNYVIRTEKEVLDKMNDWCIRQHGHSGLTKACLDPEKSFQHADVRAAILAYVRDRIPLPYHACLAGSTVHADAKFLHKEMPEVCIHSQKIRLTIANRFSPSPFQLMSHLHYRIVDVSSIKELVARWYGEEKRWTGGKGNHRALDDIKGSIEELKHYRKRFFTKQ